MQVGEVIKRARKALGLRQSDLARRLGNVTHVAISQWEAGLTLPSIAARIDLADILGLRFIDLLPELEKRGEFVSDPEIVSVVRALERATPADRATISRFAWLLAEDAQKSQPSPAPVREPAKIEN
jgi:transcriptional regulator with XRE-family HTH domain